MDSTTGGDANDEFARWLAETARQEQAAQAGSPQADEPAAAQPAQAPAAAPPVQPAPTPPAAPEFFGADELAAPPPTRPYEPQLGGPPVARSSYQPPSAASEPSASAPATPAPNEYVTPTVLPAAEPAPPASDLPSWAPGYQAPPAAAPSFFPPAEQAPPATTPYTPAPSFETAPPPTAEPYTPPVTPTTYEPAPSAEPVAFEAPVQPQSPPAWDAPPAPQDVPTEAYSSQPPAPSFQPPAYEPPATASAFPSISEPSAAPAFTPPAEPAFVEPSASVTPPPAQPVADPFGALFTDSSDDTASRLAASPPPSFDAPPLVSPETESLPSDEDPMKSLFGLETEEQPAIRFDSDIAEPPAYVPDPVFSTPPAAEPVLAPDPVFTPPAYTPDPVYTPEPAFAEPTYPAGAAPSSDPVLTTTPAAAPEPAFAVASPAASSGGSYALTQPGTAPADDDPNAGTQFFGGGAGEWEQPPDFDHTTTAEKVGLGLAIVLPPIGLIAGIVNAVQSSRERGWVHRFVRVSLVVAAVMTVVAGFAGAYVYKVIDDGRKHDQVAAASTQFCSTIAADPSMISPPSFGFPSPGATIEDTITIFQAYVDKWTALAKVSPSGIRTDVNRVADAAQTILDGVSDSRLVDNDVNQQQMSSLAESTNIVGWDQEYCG